MKKIIFLILNVFVISNLGFSKIYNVGNIIFDDRIFGETKMCQIIGLHYLSIVELHTTKSVYEELLSEDEVINNQYVNINHSIIISEQLKKEGWNKNSVAIENINSYYKSNCRRIKMGEIKGDGSEYSNFFEYSLYYLMNSIGMFGEKNIKKEIK